MRECEKKRNSVKLYIWQGTNSFEDAWNERTLPGARATSHIFFRKVKKARYESDGKGRASKEYNIYLLPHHFQAVSPFHTFIEMSWGEKKHSMSLLFLSRVVRVSSHAFPNLMIQKRAPTSTYVSRIIASSLGLCLLFLQWLKPRNQMILNLFCAQTIERSSPGLFAALSLQF